MDHASGISKLALIQPAQSPYPPQDYTASTLDACLAGHLSVLQTSLNTAIIRERKAHDAASALQFQGVDDDLRQMQQFLEASNCQTRDVIGRTCDISQEILEEVKRVDDKIAEVAGYVVSRQDWEKNRRAIDAKLDSILDTLARSHTETQAAIQTLSAGLVDRMDTLERVVNAGLFNHNSDHLTLPVQIMPMLTSLVKDLVSRNTQRGKQL